MPFVRIGRSPFEQAHNYVGLRQKRHSIPQMEGWFALQDFPITFRCRTNVKRVRWSYELRGYAAGCRQFYRTQDSHGN